MNTARTKLAISLLLALGVAACADVPEAPRATVAPASPTTATQPPAAEGATETLALDPAASSLVFVGAKVTAQHEGRFSDVTGSVRLDPADLTRSSFDLRVGIASLAIEPARLQGHLLSPDLLDVAQFPEATFRSTSIVAGGAAGATHTVTGDLTLHGRTKRVSFPATITVAASNVTARAEFTIDRRDFGVVYPGMPDDLIKDDVVLRIALSAPRTAR